MSDKTIKILFLLQNPSRYYPVVSPWLQKYRIAPLLALAVAVQCYLLSRVHFAGIMEGSILSGLLVTGLIIISMYVHELGHIVASVYRKDHRAMICLKGFQLFAISSYRIDTETNTMLPVTLPLAGVFFQLLFASLSASFGYAFGGPATAPAIAAMIAIDFIALYALLPFPQKDGEAFLSRLYAKAPYRPLIFYLRTRPRAVGLAVSLFYLTLCMSISGLVVSHMVEAGAVTTAQSFFPVSGAIVVFVTTWLTGAVFMNALPLLKG